MQALLQVSKHDISPEKESPERDYATAVIVDPIKRLL